MAHGKRRIGSACCLLGATLLLWLGPLLMTWLVGTDAALYERLQLRADIAGSAGISIETLREADAMLSDCLRGERTALLEPGTTVARSGIVFGVEQPLFNERELAHMEDCRRLFVLLRVAMMGCCLLGTALTLLGRRLLRRESARRRCCVRLGALVAVLPILCFGLWAAADFDAAFTCFHRLLFTNDLWLLDPATDLLIRICPESMFMTMGLLIAGGTLLWCGAVVQLLSCPKGNEGTPGKERRHADRAY